MPTAMQRVHWQRIVVAVGVGLAGVHGHATHVEPGTRLASSESSHHAAADLQPWGSRAIARHGPHGRDERSRDQLQAASDQQVPTVTHKESHWPTAA